MPVRQPLPSRFGDGPERDVRSLGGGSTAGISAAPERVPAAGAAVDFEHAGFGDARLLHRGSQFEHLLVRESATGREVVLKRPADPEHHWLSAVLDEQATLLADLGRHPHITTLLQRLQTADGRSGIVLEHLPRTAVHLLHGGTPLAPADVAAFGIQLAGALETIRSAGLVHCDVRPAVVRLTQWDEPVLGGFDEVVHLHPQLASYAVLHESSAYTAPELLFGHEATPRADVYGLGATLFDLLSGHGAFRAYAGESPAQVIARALADHTPHVVIPNVPLELADLIAWSLAADPRDRPPNAAWMAEELGRIQRDQGWPRTPVRTA